MIVMNVQDKELARLGRVYGKLTILEVLQRLEIAERDLKTITNDLYKITDGMEQHPEGWEHACMCDLCKSYG